MYKKTCSSRFQFITKPSQRTRHTHIPNVYLHSTHHSLYTDHHHHACPAGDNPNVHGSSNSGASSSLLYRHSSTLAAQSRRHTQIPVRLCSLELSAYHMHYSVTSLLRYHQYMLKSRKEQELTKTNGRVCCSAAALTGSVPVPAQFQHRTHHRFVQTVPQTTKPFFLPYYVSHLELHFSIWIRFRSQVRIFRIPVTL
jgi:hypothetical protein